ncbi:MAG: glycosyltransferase family 9 protein [Bacteroidia bacterium]|nr:glycosyltransferase family 9 protein [Bacteroidia bacterium]
MKKIIVFRLSAMGDVLLTVPVIKSILEANTELEITLVTRQFFAPFFYGIPRLNLIYPDLKGKHKGFLGLIKLFFELKKQGPFESVVDLHGVIRTRLISLLFKVTGSKSFAIDKGRKEKKFLLKSKYIRILKHSTVRYFDTFEKAGLKGSLGKAPYLAIDDQAKNNANLFLEKCQITGSKYKIGLAPFATYQTKMWGVENFKALINLINTQFEVEFLLFGGGDHEIKQLTELKSCASNVHLAAGVLKLSEEIALVQSLDLMISMDSSNMHLATLCAVPTVSIWGGTHPAFGFFALGHSLEHHIQTPATSLKCRPCSVFGNKPCIYDKPKCMEMVTPSDVLKRLIQLKLLKNKQA